jgi:putative membrane protein
MTKISMSFGVLLFILLMITLAATASGGSFTAHMIVHMGVVAVASPFIAIGLADTGFDPMRFFPWLTPVVASVIELVLVWLWHAPAIRDLGNTSPLMSALEQASFLIGGMTLWLSCLRKGDGNPRLAGTIGLLFTSIHMTLLGVLLTLAPRPLYGRADVTCFGIVLNAETDQQIGGVVMLLIGAISYLVGGVVVLSRILKAHPDTATEGN